MTPSTQAQIPLDELNELIAKQKGISVEELAVNDGSQPKPEPKAKTPQVEETKVSDEVKFNLTPAEMRSRADALYKEAARLRKEADELDPPKKKTKAEKVEA
jgi:hypothetical protein